MEELLPFLQSYEDWIYIFLGSVAFVSFLKVASAWRDWRGALFGLEREIALRRFSLNLTIFLLLVVFVLLEFFIVTFVVPSYPQIAVLPTPTLDLLATTTATLPVMGQAATAEVTQDVNVTPTTNMLTLQEGCIEGQIEWSFPRPGEEISATIELKGTVNVPNLGFYKYEYTTPGDDVWLPIAAGNQPKVDGVVGFWNTSQLLSGDYLLRLVVFDNQDNPFPACVIPVRVIQR